MATIIDKSFNDNSALLEYLNSQGELSLGALVEESFRKTLALSAASYFESTITDAIHNYCVKQTSGDACMVSMVRIMVRPQYFKFFQWGDKPNAGPLFRLFGNSLGIELKQEVKNEPLKGNLAAFLELGELRNCLVHQNFANYAFEKTTKEVYELYVKASGFVNRIIEKLDMQPITHTDIRQRVRDRAYAIYSARGNEHGNAEEDWLQAEEEVRSGLTIL